LSNKYTDLYKYFDVYFFIQFVGCQHFKPKLTLTRLTAYLITDQVITPLMIAVTGIAIIVKVLQNLEFFAYLADKDDCIL